MSTNSEGPVEQTKERPWWRRNWVYILAFLAAIGIMCAFIPFAGRAEEFENYGYLGIFFMGVIGSAAPIWPLPGSWAAFIGGGLGWNPFLVAVAAGIGEPVGELTYYMLGYSGRPVLQNWSKYHRVENWMKRHGTITLFLVSAIPNPVIRVADVSAGTLRFPVWKFFLILCLGKTIKALAFAFAGAGLFSWLAELLS